MKTPVTGGCLCGAVRYESTAEPIMMLKCHCRDCQHATGGPFAPAVLFPAKAFKLTKGSLHYHLTPGGTGGRHKRGFCGECGARITGGESDTPSDMVGVLAGSLTIQVSFGLRWISLLLTRNGGISSIPACKNSRNILPPRS